MSNTPKVSVIVPNYNYARYLPERIQSILDQTFTDYELIILDDGSSDDSAQIIKKYAAQDERIQTKFFTKNGGQTLRLHRLGAEMARGEYLYVAEADDSCHPTLLAHFVRVLDEHPSVGRVSAPNLALQSDELDEVLPELQQRHIPTVTVRIPDRAEDIRQITIANRVPCISSAMIRRSVYDQTGGFDPSFTISGDWKLWWECAITADVAHLDAPLNYWRRHSTSVSNVGHWHAAKTVLLEDAQLAIYFTRHPEVRPVLTDDVLRVIKRARMNSFVRLLVYRVRTRRQLREALPIYRNIRQIDRLAPLRFVRVALRELVTLIAIKVFLWLMRWRPMRAVWRLGARRAYHWLVRRGR